MISRSNRYVAADKKQLRQVRGNKGKRTLVTVGTLLLTVTLLSGCGKGRIDDFSPSAKSDTIIEIMYENVDEVDLSSFSMDTDEIEIIGTNLTDVSELSNYKKVERIDISDNLVTDISALESLPELRYLDISIS